MAKYFFNEDLILNLLPQKKPYVVWDRNLIGLGCNVQPSGKKKYFLRYTHRGYQRYAKLGYHPTMSYVKAQELALNLLSSLKKGLDPKKRMQRETISFADFWPKFQQHHIQQKWSVSTRKYAQSRIRDVLDFFGDMQLHSINRDTILEYSEHLNNLKRGDSVFTKTVNEILSPLFNTAILLGYKEFHSNPCVSLPKYNKKFAPQPLNADDIRNFCQKLEDSQEDICNKAIVYLALYNGLRLGEILNLKWANIDFEKKYIHFQTSKTGAKTLPISDKIIEILQSLPNKESIYLFPTKDNLNVPLKNIKSFWNRFRKRCNVNIRFHDLRHTFVTQALRQTGDIARVSKLAGHKNIRTTMLYTHLMPEDTRAALEVTNASFCVL